MTTRQHLPVSNWLLQLIGPLWLFAFCFVFHEWMPADNASAPEGNEQGGPLLFTLYCMVQAIGWTQVIIRFGAKRWNILFIFGGIIIPAFSTVFLYRSNFVETAAWYEVAGMAALLVWIAVSACLILVWTGIVMYGLRAYWVVPLSIGAVLLAFEAFVNLNNLLLITLSLYGIPILYVAMRDSLREERSAPKAPS